MKFTGSQPLRAHCNSTIIYFTSANKNLTQFVKVLLVKLSDMLYSSNFVKLFLRQSCTLYSRHCTYNHIISVLYIPYIVYWCVVVYILYTVIEQHNSTSCKWLVYQLQVHTYCNWSALNQLPSCCMWQCFVTSNALCASTLPVANLKWCATLSDWNRWKGISMHPTVVFRQHVWYSKSLMHSTPKSKWSRLAA